MSGRALNQPPLGITLHPRSAVRAEDQARQWGLDRPALATLRKESMVGKAAENHQLKKALSQGWRGTPRLPRHRCSQGRQVAVSSHGGAHEWRLRSPGRQQ